MDELLRKLEKSRAQVIEAREHLTNCEELYMQHVEYVANQVRLLRREPKTKDAGGEQTGAVRDV